MESTGTRFVGDGIEKFGPGEIVLIGKNLPHLWLNDKIYFDENPGLMAKAFVVHFDENFAGGLLKIPEMAQIDNLIELARCGLKFEDASNPNIIKRVKKMFESTGYDKVIALLDVLKCLSEQKKYKMLSSTGYINSFKELHNTKIVRVYEHIMNNFKEDISLESVASLANMNPSAFSRYFKGIHKKTFTQYLNEVRVGYACKLLIEEKCSIAGVSFEAGFNNLSNFNRQFKSLKQMSPSEYMKLHFSV